METLGTIHFHFKSEQMEGPDSSAFEIQQIAPGDVITAK